MTDTDPLNVVSRTGAGRFNALCQNPLTLSEWKAHRALLSSSTSPTYKILFKFKYTAEETTTIARICTTMLSQAHVAW